MQATLERLRARRDERGDEGGFTLIELLIVIVILGILAGIVVFAVQNLSGSSAQASCKSSFKTVETAVEAYKAQEGAYPKNGATPTFGVAAADTNAVNALLQKDGTNNVGPWIRDIPWSQGHYQIVVVPNGNGTVSVYTATGTEPTTDNTIVAGNTQIGATNTATDCNGVN